ncbi:MAG TPA: hypothetical protein VKB75_16280 [Jatrophihabitans sp.]|nr:hypothetical protein [Jatrophihabitans sp.]
MTLLSRVPPQRRWPITLAVLALLAFLATCVVFAPGYMSNDTIFQLRQAKGRIPLNDWHPPAMSLVWKALIKVTGTVASMEVLQVLVLWAALWVIAWEVWEASASKAKSLAILALGVTPHILTFVGVIWKDVQMAFALLAVVAIAMLAKREWAARPAWRWTLFALGTLFLAYAILVRKNAIFAAVPMFVLLVLALWGRPARRVWVISVIALVVGVLVPTVAISAFAKPQKTSQVSQIMLDDLLHVLTPKQLAATHVSPDLRQHLVRAARSCARTHSLSNSYWTCYREGAHGPFTSVAHSNEITSLWIRQMSSHIPAYLSYRVDVFSQLLFNGNYFFQPGVKSNNLGVTLAHGRLEQALRTYVIGMHNDLPWLYSGWFWLLIGLVLAIRPGHGRYRLIVRTLSLSSVLYIIGYFPIMPAANYRYVYWSAIAGSLALVLLWAGRIRPGVVDGANAEQPAEVGSESEPDSDERTEPAHEDAAEEDAPATR